MRHITWVLFQAASDPIFLSPGAAMFCQENQNQYHLTITLYIGKHGRTRREDDGVAGILEQNPGKVA